MLGHTDFQVEVGAGHAEDIHVSLSEPPLWEHNPHSVHGVLVVRTPGHDPVQVGAFDSFSRKRLGEQDLDGSTTPSWGRGGLEPALWQRRWGLAGVNRAVGSLARGAPMVTP